MSPLSTKTILLLLCGPIRFPPRGRAAVRTQEETRLWLQQTPELSLLGTVHGELLEHRADDGEQHLVWQELAGTIARQYRTADGFVVLLPENILAYTSAALCLMLRGIGKPVVLTAHDPKPEPEAPRRASSDKAARGRPPAKPSGLRVRSTLVNAVQFATLDLGDIAVLHENTLYRAATYVPPSAAPQFRRDVGIIGAADFGLKIGSGRHRRMGTRFRARTAVKPRVVHVVLTPNAILPLPETLQRHRLDGMLVSLLGTDVPDSFAAVAAEARAAHVAVALYAPFGVRQRPPGVHVITNVTPHMAIVKFMWALGQERTFPGVQRLLDANLVGEQDVQEETET